jgi:hypothetical protein
MHFALSGIAHAFRIIRHRPCISHYQASPMHIALLGIRHRRCVFISLPVKNGIEWYRMVWRDIRTFCVSREVINVNDVI